MSKNMFGPPTAHPIPLGRLSKCQGRRVGRRGGSHFRKFMTRDIFLGVEKCQIFVFAKMKNDHTQSRMIIQVSELSGHVERHFSPLQLRSVLLILVFHQNSRKWKNTPKMLWAWDFPLYGDPKSLDMPSLWRPKIYFVAECGWCFS